MIENSHNCTPGTSSTTTRTEPAGDSMYEQLMRLILMLADGAEIVKAARKALFKSWRVDAGLSLVVRTSLIIMRLRFD